MTSSVRARVRGLWLTALIALLGGCDRYPRDNPFDPANNPDNPDGGREGGVSGDAGSDGLVIDDLDGAAPDGADGGDGLVIFSEEISIDDDPKANPLNNGNGKVDPGEQISLSVRLINRGRTVASGVTALVSSESDCVLSTQAKGTRGQRVHRAPYGDIAPGQVSPSGNPSVGFEIGFSPNPTICVEGAEVLFTLEATDESGQNWELKFNLSIAKNNVVLSIVEVSVADDLYDSLYNNDNQRIEPGEIVHLRLFLKNEGNSIARGVQGTLSSKSACVVSAQIRGTDGAPFPYGDIHPGVTQPKQGTSIYYEVLFSPEACAPGDTVELLLTVWDASSRQWNLTRKLKVYRTDAAIEYNRHTVDDRPAFLETNNGDGLVDPGEVVHLFVRLRNSGTSTAREVTLGVSELQPSCISQARIQTDSGRIAYGDVLAQNPSVRPSGNNFVEVHFTTACASGETVALNLVAEDYPGNTWPVELPVKVQ